MTIKDNLSRLLADDLIPGEFLTPKGAINQSALARALNIKPAAVNQWFSEETKWPHQALQRQLAKVLTLPLSDVGQPGLVDFETAPPPKGAPRGAKAFPLAEFQQGPTNLPVWGTGRGGEEGSFLFYAHEAVDWVKRPAVLESVKDAFAVYLEGDSMEPWAEAGDPLAINPSRHPAPGSHVLVELHPEREGDNTSAMVKKLVRRTAHTLVLLQYNPRKEIEIEMARVKAIYRIMERRDLMPT